MTKTLNIPRVSGSIADAIKALDGDKCAEINIEEANWSGLFPDFAPTRMRAVHDGKAMYLRFEVESPAFRAVNRTDQSPVSEDCCVEAFFQPVEGGEYWNFEFNSIGMLNASHRIERPAPTRLLPSELIEVGRIPHNDECAAEGLAAAWGLTAIIPFSLMGMEDVAPGTGIRGNFYSCASKSQKPYYQSWNPIDTPKPDFHRPEFFGDIILD